MRREIVATFGFPRLDHPYRVAVFSWPDCQTIVRIPWHDGGPFNIRDTSLRALSAVAYSGGPSDMFLSSVRRSRSEAGKDWNPTASRTMREGCIVVASSEGSIRFHEVWAGKLGVAPWSKIEGLLGGSDILEALEGIEKESTGDVIR